MNVKHERKPENYTRSLEKKTNAAVENHQTYVCACLLFCEREMKWYAFGRIADISKEGDRCVRELRSIRHVHNAELDKNAIVSVIQCACADAETFLIFQKYCRKKNDQLIMNPNGSDMEEEKKVLSLPQGQREEFLRNITERKHLEISKQTSLLLSTFPAVFMSEQNEASEEEEKSLYNFWHKFASLGNNMHANGCCGRIAIMLAKPVKDEKVSWMFATSGGSLRDNFASYVRACMNISNHSTAIYRLAPVQVAMSMRNNVIPPDTIYSFNSDSCNAERRKRSTTDTATLKENTNLSALDVLNNQLKVAAESVAKKMRQSAGLSISAINSRGSTSTTIVQKIEDVIVPESVDIASSTVTIEINVNDNSKGKMKRCKRQPKSEAIEIVTQKWVFCDGPCKKWLKTDKDYGEEEIFLCSSCSILSHK